MPGSSGPCPQSNAENNKIHFSMPHSIAQIANSKTSTFNDGNNYLS